jgi:hypothetical protein
MAIDLDAKVREKAAAFAADIAALVRQSIADQVLRLVDSATANRAAAPSVGARRGPKPGRRTGLAASRARSRKVDDKAVLAAIPSKGISAIDLAKATGLVSGALSYRLNKLRAAKKVRSTGRTSKMKYFLV